ncbi:hypothetical protein S40293_08290 [Stachybotrys chartarum IBT 40293]|nr:hypothetical protein S40293_08290 [Stachybotrys chartarum IBT 40293]
MEANPDGQLNKHAWPCDLPKRLRSAFTGQQPYEDTNSKFLPLSKMHEMIEPETVRAYMHACHSEAANNVPETHPLHEASDRCYAIAQYVCGMSDGEPNDLDSAKKIFSILLKLEKVPQIIHFIQQGIKDKDLPFVKINEDGENFDLLMNDGRQPSLFCLPEEQPERSLLVNSQWGLLSPILRPGDGKKFTRYEFKNEEILPFLEAEQLLSDDESPNSKIWKVTVDGLHHQFGKGNDRFALKQLGLLHKEWFNWEIDAYEKIPLHNHLTPLYATIKHRGHFHLLLPLATGSSLYSMWHQNAPKQSNSQWLWFAEQCLGLASGLGCIHNTDLGRTAIPFENLPWSADDRTCGRHGDIKPNNVLWFRDQDHDSKAHVNGNGKDEHGEHGRLRICDFGLTRFSHPGATMTSAGMLRLTQTYRPPEYDTVKKVSRAFDIWSLGGMYLEMITWLLLGGEGVNDFEEKRMEDVVWEMGDYKKTDDFFHNPKPYAGGNHDTVKETGPDSTSTLAITKTRRTTVPQLIKTIAKSFLEKGRSRMMKSKKPVVEQPAGEQPVGEQPVVKPSVIATLSISSPIIGLHTYPDRSMTLNNPGTVRRTIDQQPADFQQVHDNFTAEAWKQWPNEAGFDGLTEHRGPLSLPVRGTIPAWAAGALYRTGPGQSKIEDTPRGTHFVSHWFDGFAQTHKFDIVPPRGEDGGGAASVLYSSRRQSEDLVAQIKKAGWRSATSFGQRADPCVGIFAKAMSVFEPNTMNNNVVVNVNVPGYPSKGAPGAGHRTRTSNVFIGTDNTHMVEAHPDTLEPLGTTDQSSLHPELKGPLSCAHPQRDPDTGDLYNFNLELGRSPVYRVFRVNAAAGTTDVLATISSDAPAAYIHSFFLTENYVVLCIPSSHYAWQGLKIPWERNLIDALLPFDEARASRWIVVDRRHGEGVVARFTTPAGFFFHSVNGFEEQTRDEDGQLHTDVCLDHVLYDSLDIMTAYYYDVILDRDGAMRKHRLEDNRFTKLAPRLSRYRFRIPPSPSSSLAATEVLTIAAPYIGELPTINPQRSIKPYRYIYSNPNRGLSTLMDCIAKTDLHTRETTFWNGPAAHSPSEPIFVPRPGGADEDDGVLLSVVLDGVRGVSYLLCLDARTMEELGRAEAEFAIGVGFHGVHAPQVEDDE